MKPLCDLNDKIHREKAILKGFGNIEYSPIFKTARVVKNI